VKLRSLLLLAAGVFLGMKLSEKLHEDDPNVLHGPQRARAESRPALRVVSARVQRLSDAAASRGLDAIRRLRGQLRDRLGETDDDVAAWN
jgi:hypothetical protein